MEQDPVQNSGLQIDESIQKPVPTIFQRIKNALLSLILGFILAQIVGFWMFPGMGLGAFDFFSFYAPFNDLGRVINVYILSFLAICALMGWVVGEYFTQRLKGFIIYWKFW